MVGSHTFLLVSIGLDRGEMREVGLGLPLPVLLVMLSPCAEMTELDQRLPVPSGRQVWEP